MLGNGQSRRQRFTLCAAGVVACALTAGNALAADPFDSKGLDDTSSMGVFRIAVDAKFAPYFTCLLGPSSVFWDASTSRLTSPVLVDQNTIIQRSNPRNVHDNTALACGDGGVQPHKIPDTMISDLDFAKIPAGFEYLLPEVHTNVYSLNLQPNMFCGLTLPCTGGTVPVSVKAGLGQGLSKCPGEVASPGGKGFPGESFFNVFVQVDIGTGPIFSLYNDATHPLVITASGLNDFPPRVVYIHGVTAAVPILTRTSGKIVDACLPSGRLDWNADELFGYLVLAGHGVETSCADTTACEMFYDQVITNGKEMPLPGSIPGVSGWGMVALLILLLGTGIWFFRNRSQVEEASA